MLGNKRIFRNFYFITGGLFFIWMLFFDTNDFISQYNLYKKHKDLQEQKTYYNSKIAEVKEDRHELYSDKQLLEKFARENYLMKKEGEDLFVVISKD